MLSATSLPLRSSVGANFLSVFDQPQRESLGILFLDVRSYGYEVGWIFGL